MSTPATRLGSRRWNRALNASAILGAAATLATVLAAATPANATAGHFQVPAGATQLLVISSPTRVPADHLATFRAYERATARSAWRLVIGPWSAEIGYSGLRDRRREGDVSTPTGVFGIAPRIYGIHPNPGRLHYAYRRLVCGDWWDEDPFSPRYNRLVHVPCGVTPRFAPRSEPLWRETVAYPYFAVIRFNLDPTVRGRDAPGSGIFLHSWVAGATAGCVALPRRRLLAVLRWLRPSARPVVAIGIVGELGSILP